MRLIILPESLVDVTVLMLVPTFTVSLVVAPFSFVPISVLEVLLAPSLALVIAIQISRVHASLVLLQAVLFDEVETLFFDHEQKLLLVGVRPVRSILASLTQGSIVLVCAAQVDLALAEGVHAINGR